MARVCESVSIHLILFWIEYEVKFLKVASLTVKVYFYCTDRRQYLTCSVRLKVSKWGCVIFAIKNREPIVQKVGSICRSVQVVSRELCLQRHEHKDVEGKKRLGKDAKGSLKTQISIDTSSR